jgi:hypothetical protein
MMIQSLRTFQGLTVLGILVLGLSSGCTIKATIDTLTNGTTNFLSSTTGKSWWTEDGLVKREEYAKAFVAINHDVLLQDIARGQGEYVQSFGTILGIPPSQQAHFRQLLQDQYSVLVEIPILLGEDQLTSFIAQAQEAGIRSVSPNRQS